MYLDGLIKRICGFSMLGLRDSGNESSVGRNIESQSEKVFGRVSDGSGEAIQQAGAMTPEEQAQYKGSFELGSTIEQLLKYQQGLGPAPAGYLDSTQQYLQQTGAVGQGLYDQVLKGIQNPDALYQSTLQPQLDLASNYVNQQYNTRGLVGSGLQLEQMGRAGAELAVAEAQARMANRQNQIINASSLAGNIYGVQQQDINNMMNLYGQQQNVAQGQRAMQAQYEAYPEQAQLGQAYGMQNAYISNVSKLLGSGISASYMGTGVNTGTGSTGVTGTSGSSGGNSQQPTYQQPTYQQPMYQQPQGQYGYVPQSSGGLSAAYSQQPVGAGMNGQPTYGYGSGTAGY